MAIERTPIDLIRFVSIENEQFLVSLANNKDELKVLSHIQGLYNAAMSYKTVDENDLVIFQLLTFAEKAENELMACVLSMHRMLGSVVTRYYPKGRCILYGLRLGMMWCSWRSV